MAGKNQHYLPRFLLSGFASRITKKSHFCFVYHKDGRKFEPNITGVGAEGYFYGKPEESDADQVITEAESQFGCKINRLRELEASEDIDSADVAALVAHLSIRTRNIRSSVQSAVDQIFEGFSSSVRDPEYLRKIALEDFRKDPRKVWDQTASAKFGRTWEELERWQKRKYKREYVAHLKSRPSDDPVFGQIARAFISIEGEIPKSLRKGHNQALEKSVSLPAWKEAMGNLNWQVLSFPEHSLILGDVGPVARCFGEKPPTALALSKNDLGTVCLPICHSKLLVGSEAAELPRIESREINKVSAELSWDFFASSIQSESRESIANRIGILAREQMEKAASDTIKRI